MATAQTLIDRAMRLIGAVESGESPTPTESNDCLTALNAMIGSWRTERLIVYAYVDTAFATVVGDNSYTVGPSGNFDLTPRPVRLENCFVRASNIDYLVEMVDQERWFAIPDKTSESDIPKYGYYEPSLPTGTLLLWPVPNSAHSLHVVTWSPMGNFASLSTAAELPQGYERALAYNLAVELSAEFQLPLPPIVQQIAGESLAMIKRANQRPMKAYTELGILISHQRSNIFSGGPA